MAAERSNILAGWLLMLAWAGAVAEEFVTPGDTSPALGGFSPISYFGDGEPQPGLPQHAASHDGVTYYFRSATEVQRFREDPESYAPLFPHHCPYNLALGRAAAIDPTNFRIVAGRLLVFHRSEEMDGREEWTRHDAGEQERLLERARGLRKLIRF